MSSGQLWTTQSGFLFSAKLSEHLMYSAQPLFRFRQFVDLKQAFGKGMGDSFNWDKIANVSNMGGKLTETSTMNETTQTLSKGTLTVTEYGNSIPYTGKIEALSFTDISKMIDKGLRDDLVKCLDGEVEQKGFTLTPLRYVGTSASGSAVTTNSVATATNTSALNTFHLEQMLLELEKRYVPGFGDLGNDYVCIASVEAANGLRDALISVRQYTPEGYASIVNGELGRFLNCRVVKDSFASRYKYDSTALTATLFSWTNSGTSRTGPAYVFGADTVTEAVAVPEEIRAKIPTDYGRSKGLAWYFIGGWQIEWSDEPNARIIKWDSAG